MSKLTAISIAILFSVSVSAQEKSSYSALMLLEPGELQADFDEVIKIMQQHPALTVFTSEAEWSDIIKEQKAKLNSAMTVAKFFDVCAQVVHRIRCGHTGLDLPNDFWKKGERALFSIPVMIINDSIFVRDDSGSGVPKGALIVRINGKSTGEIVTRLQTYISADGMNITWKTLRLNQSLNNFLSLYFNFVQQYEVTYETSSDVETTVVLPAVRSGDFNYPHRNKELLTYSLTKPGNTAVIGIHSFNYYRKDTVKFYRAINDFFTRAHSDKVKNLILDLRGNTGGDPFSATHLLSYLESKPFVYYGETYDWCKNLSKPYPMKAKRFKGNLYVLVDGLCFSTTGHLLSVMKVNKVGTMIGEESGGTYTCNDSGKWFELKNSKLRLRMARVSFKTTADSLPRDKGVLPDHEVKVSSRDVLSGRDAVMEYALKLAAEQ
jgi:C-terminal processing protease CtpA/Prc